MKLLTFRKRGGKITRVGTMSAGGEEVDLTSAYASYLFDRGDPHPVQFANAYIPTDMIGFILGGETSLKAAGIALAHAEAKKQEGNPLNDIKKDGSKGLTLYDSNSNPRAGLRLLEDGSTGLLFLDVNGNTRAGLNLLKDGSPSLSFLDDKGNPVWSAP